MKGCSVFYLCHNKSFYQICMICSVKRLNLTLKSKAVKSVLWEEGRGVCSLAAQMVQTHESVMRVCKKYESVSNRCWPPHDSKQREKQELKISPSSCWLFSCPYRENTWSIEYATTQCVRYAIRKTIKCAKPKIRQGTHTLQTCSLSV